MTTYTENGQPIDPNLNLEGRFAHIDAHQAHLEAIPTSHKGPWRQWLRCQCGWKRDLGPTPSPTYVADAWFASHGFLYNDIHTFFNLTYANYLTLPRSLLQSMPEAWQAQLVRLLDQLELAYRHLDHPSYRVNAVNEDGRYIADPIPHYNRGRIHVPRADELDE